MERIVPSWFVSTSTWRSKLGHLEVAREAPEHVKAAWIEDIRRAVAVLDEERIRGRDLQLLLDPTTESPRARIFDFGRYLLESEVPAQWPNPETNREQAAEIIRRLTMEPKEFAQWLGRRADPATVSRKHGER